MFLGVSSISHALNITYTLNRFEPRQPEVCEDVCSTTSNAYEKVLLSGTHMAFFAVFLFVTLNIRRKFRFLSFKDGGHTVSQLDKVKLARKMARKCCYHQSFSAIPNLRDNWGELEMHEQIYTSSPLDTNAQVNDGN